MLTLQTLDVYKNSDQDIKVTVTQDGVAVNLTGCKLIFTVKNAPASQLDAAALLQKTSPSGGIVITSAAGGLATISIAASDTVSVSAPANYQWDLRIIEAGGKARESAAGTFRVLQNVTTATS